jgi:hypothetical protein
MCAVTVVGVVLNLEICRGQDVAKPVEIQPDLATPVNVSCVFAERTAHFRYAQDKAERVRRVEWQLTVGDRTVSRGAGQPDSVADANSSDHVALSLKMPPVNPGVVVASELDVTLHADAASESFTQPIYIFADDPFVDREQWLRKVDIRLFDPNRETIGVFEEHGIPFQQVTTVAAIDAVRNGMLVLGEGVSWSDHIDAVQAARRAARRGLRVLCLAPKEGEMPLYSESSDESAEILNMLAAREDVIRRFDKRFDTRDWAGGTSVVSRVKLVSESKLLLARVTASSNGWPLLDLQFRVSSASGSGALIVCGLGIIEYWDEGPVPRYLFKAILERFTTNRK